MAKFYGCKPAVPTRQAVEKFENEVIVRHKNQVLISKIYLDMQDNSWTVAVVYNLSRKPGLHGHQNALEVRYSYSIGEQGIINVFRSDPGTITELGAGPFDDQDIFFQHALKLERRVVNPVT